MSCQINKVHALTRSHHGLVETTQVINLPRPGGLALRENMSKLCAKSLCLSMMFSSADAVFLVPPTSISKIRQGLRCDRKGNKPTCLESGKIPGRYQANITPCLSIITHGVDIATLSRGGYRSLRDSSFSIDAFVPGLKGFRGRLSA